MAAVPAADRAQAEVLIAINKATQRMTVAVNGREHHRWPVSTGLAGGPPSGHYRPDRMERTWYSRKYNWSPMPHAIFFHKGYAIHGTIYLSRLGQPGLARLRAAASAARRRAVRAGARRRHEPHRHRGVRLVATRRAPMVSGRSVGASAGRRGTYSMTISPTMPRSACDLPSLTMPQRRSVTRPVATGTNHHSALWPG